MNEPLTLEQLRNKLGKPIFLETGEVSIKEQLIARWTILENWDGPWFDFYKRKKLFHEKDYGITWLAYAYPPAHIDREAWEGCVCNSGKKNCCTCISMACHLCIGESKYIQGKYCSSCGRPLTEEAWKELEKRVRGEK